MEIGNWKMETGKWKLETGTRNLGKKPLIFLLSLD